MENQLVDGTSLEAPADEIETSLTQRLPLTELHETAYVKHRSGRLQKYSRRPS